MELWTLLLSRILASLAYSELEPIDIQDGQWLRIDRGCKTAALCTDRIERTIYFLPLNALLRHTSSPLFPCSLW